MIHYNFYWNTVFIVWKRSVWTEYTNNFLVQFFGILLMYFSNRIWFGLFELSWITLLKLLEKFPFAGGNPPRLYELSLLIKTIFLNHVFAKLPSFLICMNVYLCDTLKILKMIKEFEKQTVWRFIVESPHQDHCKLPAVSSEHSSISVHENKVCLIIQEESAPKVCIFFLLRSLSLKSIWVQLVHLSQFIRVLHWKHRAISQSFIKCKPSTGLIRSSWGNIRCFPSINLFAPMYPEASSSTSLQKCFCNSKIGNGPWHPWTLVLNSYIFRTRLYGC